MSAPLRPFEQGDFRDVPEQPRLPHPYFSLETREIEVRPEGFARFRCHVRVHGSGPPLLLVHGLMTSSYSFRYLVARLGEQYTCYVPDLPGAGRSEAPVSDRYTPGAIGRVLVAIQEALGIAGCRCLGNSMGGYLAMVAALDHGPETFARLIVLHAPAVPLLRYRALALAWRMPGSAALLRALVRRDPERWAHRNVHYFDETLKSREEAREYAAPLRTDAGVEAFARYLRDTLAPEGFERLTARLRERREAGLPFPVPLQLQYSEQDPMVPPETGARLRRLVPGAGYVWLHHTSHFAHVDTPEAVLAAALPFLAPGSR
jgi:pimeloyl-ACP methyl ester carboxylesterase